MAVNADNNEEGTLKISSDSILADLEATPNPEGTLKISSASNLSSLTVTPTTESTNLKVSADGTLTTVSISETKNTNLKITADGTTQSVEVSTPESTSLKISAQNTPAYIDVEGTGTVGSLKLSSVFVSDLTIEVGETETLPAGENAYVTNSGTTKHAILDFGIPKGEAGRGIVSTDLVKTEGLIKTYRILYTDGTTFDYQVADGSGTSTSWGVITGNLENQKDLYNVLADKQPNLTSANAGQGISITGSGSNILISNTQTSAEWGNITGTLSDQKDLQDALDKKLEEIPQANSTDLGGIKADAKTSAETQEVKIDTLTGKLYTQPTTPDNETINLNTDSELQAIAVRDDNKAGATKTWSGTKAEYSALATKDDDTLYYITDDIEGNIDWGEISGDITNQTDLQNALDNKVNKNTDITGATHTKITYDNKGLVTSGADLEAEDIPNLTLNKITDVTASATELNYTKGVTSNIQTQLNSKQPTITNLSTIESNANAGKSASDTIATYGNIVTHNAGEFYLATNPDKYISGITSSDVTTALGYTPYNSTNPNKYISGITSSDVTTALGYTPYNSTNPNNYISGITSSDVTTALGYTPYNSTNPNKYISGITSSDVTTALGYTPYNSTNPSNYITLTSLSSNATGLTYNNTNGTLSLTSGYVIPTTTQAGLISTALQPSDVINNVTTATTDKPLSANMGKSLQDEIDNLKARGRYLSLWNCTTGLAQTNPETSPYNYNSGDYYIVGVVGDTNYKPNGSQYVIGQASTTVESATVNVDDVYYYDGSTWHLQINTQKTITFANIAGQPTDNSNLASALNEKVVKNSDITGATHTKITYDSKGLVTAGEDLSSSDVTTALGYTPYNSTNPNNYISGITSSDVTTALGYTPYNSTNPSQYLSALTDTVETTSLGIDTTPKLNSNNLITSGGVATELNNKLPNTIKYGADLSYTDSQLQLKDQDGNALGNAVTIETAPAIDNTTITKNTSGQLQAVSLIDLTASVSELNYVDGVTSNIQTQLNSKQATISNLSTIESNASAGKSASDTISSYGNIVTHNTSEFYLATNPNNYINNTDNCVHTTGDESVAGVKTFTGTPVFSNASNGQQLTVYRAASGNSVIKYSNSNGILGYIGIDSNGIPIMQDSSSNYKNLVRNTTRNTATGSATQPVYINASGIATAITSYEGNSATSSAVLNQNDTTTSLKTWSGTKDQYDAIETKDENTLYNITGDQDVTLTLLETIYPVGSIYLTTNSTCPLASLFGTWELVAEDRVLQGAGTRGSVNTTLSESLPSPTHTHTRGSMNITGSFGIWRGNVNNFSGALYSAGTGSVYWSNDGQESSTTTVGFDASRSGAWTGSTSDANSLPSVYSSGAKVQQDAYLVNIYRRTA